MIPTAPVSVTDSMTVSVTQDALTFGLLVLCAAGAAFLAVQSHRLTERLRIPAPAFFLVAAILAERFVPGVDEPTHRTVERVVTVALLLILFDGGLHIGLERFKAVGRVVLTVGVLGTFATVAGTAVLAYALLGIPWYAAVLLATAIAPTDPAVVFSVLGQREIAGRSGTVLEGESGANDPVGIALMAALIGAGSLTPGSLVEVGGTFLAQMVVGALVGVVGGRVLLVVMRRLPLPGEGLYPVRTLVFAGVLFGLATVAHGSGFLAVFVSGIVVGDERAPYKREIERFHSALASLGEVVAFAFLGLTVDLDVLARTDVWLPGLVLGVLLAVLVRPLLVGPFLLGSRLSRGESGFVLLSGLKGAVPLLLGSLLLSAAIEDGERLYGVVVVVVLFSVVVQGALVPTLAKRLGLRFETLEPEPFALGVRLRDEPTGAHTVRVVAGAVADGCRIEDLPGLAEGTWISLVVRDRVLLAVRSDTVLRAGDEVLLLADPLQDPTELLGLFSEPVPTG